MTVKRIFAEKRDFTLLIGYHRGDKMGREEAVEKNPKNFADTT